MAKQKKIEDRMKSKTPPPPHIPPGNLDDPFGSHSYDDQPLRNALINISLEEMGNLRHLRYSFFTQTPDWPDRIQEQVLYMIETGIENIKRTDPGLLDFPPTTFQMETDLRDLFRLMDSNLYSFTTSSAIEYFNHIRSLFCPRNPFC